MFSFYKNFNHRVKKLFIEPVDQPGVFIYENDTPE